MYCGICGKRYWGVTCHCCSGCSKDGGGTQHPQRPLVSYGQHTQQGMDSIQPEQVQSPAWYHLTVSERAHMGTIREVE